MNTIISKYNCITELNLIDFNNREILYNCSQGSNLAVENAILTLENIEKYDTSLKGFFSRLNGSKFINKPILEKYTLFYKWILNFLQENKQDQQINYIYAKTLLTDLVEVSILTVDYELNQTKTPQCSKVLQLMDQDLSYCEALKNVLLENKEINKKDLETELNIFI
jgi:hypothetical protein